MTFARISTCLLYMYQAFNAFAPDQREDLMSHLWVKNNNLQIISCEFTRLNTGCVQLF